MHGTRTNAGILIILVSLSGACGRSASTGSQAISNTRSQPTVSRPGGTATDVLASRTPAAETLPLLKDRLAKLDLPDSYVNTILFSPDGQTMITGDRNGQVLRWSRDTWESTTLVPARSTFADDEAAGVYYWGTLALSPNGNVVVGAHGDEGTVTGYDLEGRKLFDFSYGAHVWAVAISPDGKLLAVGGLRDTVVIFDLESRRPITELIGDHEYIFNLVFSPDGRTLLAGYERPSNVLRTWDTHTWQETSTFTHVSKRIDYHDLLFSPDGREIVIASTEDDVEIKFMDLATKQIVRGLPEHDRYPFQVAFSPDGRLLASVSDGVRLWDARTGRTVQRIRTDGEAGAVAFSPDGALIAFSVWGKGLQVWALSFAAGPDDRRETISS